MRLVDFSKFYKKDKYGHNVFYPFTIGKGYVVPNIEKQNKITKILQTTFNYLLVIIFFFVVGSYFFALFGVSSAFIITTYIAAICIYFYGMYKLLLYPEIRNLTPSTDEIGIIDFLITQTCMVSSAFYVIGFLIFLLIFIFRITQGIVEWKLLGFALFFAAGLALKLKCSKN